MPLEQFISLKKFSQDFDIHKKIQNLTPSINEEKGFLQRMVQSIGRKKKLKILTICDKNIELCRFLACPNILQSCTLCEVQKKFDATNSTICETFSTKFLTANGQVRNFF